KPKTTAPAEAGKEASKAEAPKAPEGYVARKEEKASADQLMKDWEKVLELKNIASTASQGVEDKTNEIAAFKGDLLKLQKELKTARGDLDRLEAAKASADLTLSKLVRNAPIIDMANPTFRIQQIVLP